MSEEIYRAEQEDMNIPPPPINTQASALIAQIELAKAKCRATLISQNAEPLKYHII